jgi:hypothetical protein
MLRLSTMPKNPAQPMIEVDLSNDTKLCKICFEKEIDCVIVPCGHTACCCECAVPLKNCPFCRNPIGSVVKMYFM